MITCTENNKNSAIFGCCKHMCGDDCHEYKNPFNWSSDGILNELLMMGIWSVIALTVLAVLELNFSFIGCLKQWFGKRKPTVKKANFFIEDLDVSKIYFILI